MGEQKHCGVITATNDALYTGAVPGGINDVVPYGSVPWNVIIVDNDDNVRGIYNLCKLFMHVWM